MARPLVSLVLVTFNSEQVLTAFFDSLETTIYPAYELIIVDNGSSDGTLELIKQRGQQARIFTNPASRGYGTGCNQGASEARGEYIGFLNPDIVVTPDWLDVMVSCFEDQPDLGVLSPEILKPGWRTRGGDVGRLDLASVPGCAMMVSRAAWDDIGSFDETIFLYWEDTDYCWRAWLRGWRVAETLDTHVFHDEGQGGAGSRRWAAEEMKNAIYVTLALRRGVKVPPLVAGRALRTIATSILWRRADILWAWAWNARHLSDTLVRRRSLRGAASAEDAARLEALIGSHTRTRVGQRVKDRFRPRLGR